MAGPDDPDHDPVHAGARGQPFRLDTQGTRAMSQRRAYFLLLFMLLYTPFLLWADAIWSESIFWQLPLGTAWAAFGLTVIPLLGGRLDVEGALCWLVFAWFMTRSRRAAVFGVVFFATSFLELVGTSVGTWTWAAQTPLFVHIPAGNPPSVISGMYCVLDGSVLVVYRLFERAIATRRLEHGIDVVAPAPALGGELAGATEATALQSQLPAELHA